MLATNISVADLRIGDRIATAVRRNRDGEIIAVLSSILIRQIDECPGAWRTHIHVNQTACYDLRFGRVDRVN